MLFDVAYLLCSPQEGDAMLSEVKGPRDHLSDSQRAWMMALMDVDVRCEVLRVRGPAAGTSQREVGRAAVIAATRGADRQMLTRGPLADAARQLCAEDLDKMSEGEEHLTSSSPPLLIRPLSGYFCPPDSSQSVSLSRHPSYKQGYEACLFICCSLQTNGIFIFVQYFSLSLSLCSSAQTWFAGTSPMRLLAFPGL
jgi:hypothetical protein